MEKVHTLPNGENLDVHCFYDNPAPKWLFDYLKTPENNYWSATKHSDILFALPSAKVWNAITYRFKSLKTVTGINQAISYCHTLIYSKADEQDRKLLLYKVYWHVKNAAFESDAQS
jgi:hypothetical protein